MKKTITLSIIDHLSEIIVGSQWTICVNSNVLDIGHNLAVVTLNIRNN